MISSISKSLREKEIIKFKFNANEKNKNQNNVNKILKTLLNKNFSRKDCLIAIGGGITGDVGGFAASLYKRGLQFINLPTTLLSQVDLLLAAKQELILKKEKILLEVFINLKLLLVTLNF